MMTDRQMENFIQQLQRNLEQLSTSQTYLQSQLSSLQQSVNILNASSPTTTTGLSNATDSYFNGTSILHKLIHIFQNSVSFLSTVTLNALTASRPLKLNASREIVASQIDLASTNDVTGLLPVSNGGTGANTAAGARANLNAAALPQTIDGSNFEYPGQSSTSCAGTQVITIDGSNFIAPVGGGACSGSQIITIDGVNFTFSVAPANNTGSQALV
jgi:hypothetical protein